MSPVFVDTWAWLALGYRRDPYHPAAVAQHRDFLRARRTYLTTDFVLSETISPLFGLLNFGEATRYVEGLWAAFDAGSHRLVHVSPGQFRRAWALRQQYADKPDISFVDLTSMVVMQDLGIDEVFTGDAHFRQVGLGFRLHP